MAIYQYKIDLIPRQSIVDKYGDIPNNLLIDHEAWERHLNKENIENDFDFEDALTIPWWKERKVLFNEIENFIDSITKLIEWSKDYTDSKSYGNNDTNDFSIGLTDEGYIGDFGVRFDLRELDKKFIENIFVLAKKIDCLLIDRKGNLFEPTFDKLVENIEQSNSFKFVSNPTDFFDKLSSAQIKPE